MLLRIEADLCVNPRQRFATGFSYGGGMSYALACTRASVFRAVAVFSGAQISGCSGHPGWRIDQPRFNAAVPGICRARPTPAARSTWSTCTAR